MEQLAGQGSISSSRGSQAQVWRRGLSRDQGTSETGTNKTGTDAYYTTRPVYAWSAAISDDNGATPKAEDYCEERVSVRKNEDSGAMDDYARA